MKGQIVEVNSSLHKANGNYGFIVTLHIFDMKERDSITMGLPVDIRIRDSL